MSDVEITIRLPEALAKESAALGVLSSAHIEMLLRADIQAQLAAMAHDPDIQRELRQIEVEFRSTEWGLQMHNKTSGVDLLVRDVLQTFTEPCREDIIEDVFLAIEGNVDWRRRYDELREELGKNVLNQAIGRCTKARVNGENPRQVPSYRSRLTTSYSKLDC